MAHITGVVIKKNATGKPTHVTLSLKQHGKFIEDYLDGLEMEKARQGETVPWEEARKRINKKFGLKS